MFVKDPPSPNFTMFMGGINMDHQFVWVVYDIAVHTLPSSKLT